MNLFRNTVKCGLCAACLALALSLSGCGVVAAVYHNKGVKAEEKGNYKEAVDDYETALVFKDFKESQCNLGRLYLKGQGTAKDEKKGAEFTLKAAEQGSTEAMHNAGILYASGTGVNKDEEKSFEWFKKAAEADCKNSFIPLGQCYVDKKQYKEAFAWFKKAADNDVSEGYVFMGLCYANGWGVKRDMKKAKQCVEKAASSSNEAAKKNAGSAGNSKR